MQPPNESPFPDSFPEPVPFGPYETLEEAQDARANQLIAEFREHFSEFRQLHPEAKRGEVYEGWALQKIAGLHVLVHLLFRQIEVLRNEME